MSTGRIRDTVLCKIIIIYVVDQNLFLKCLLHCYSRFDDTLPWISYWQQFSLPVCYCSSPFTVKQNLVGISICLAF